MEMVNPIYLMDCKALNLFQDEQISEEKHFYKVTGGCAALVALFFLGKVFVTNAGDCRALLVTPTNAQPLSNDFNPGNERKRLQYLVKLKKF